MLPALLIVALAQAPVGDLAAPDALHVAIVLDDSGSMLEGMSGSGDSKMNVAKAALRDAVAALPADARFGVFALNAYGNGPSRELLPIASHTDLEVAGVLDRVYPGGGTPLGDRIAEAADALRAERTARKYGEYRLLVITDGEATDGPQMDAAVPAALGAGLTIDVIGVAMADDHALATAVDRYRRADDPEALRDALREVLAESTGDGADAGGESDYELIAGLPDGAAPVALSALANASADTSIRERAASGGGAFPGSPIGQAPGGSPVTPANPAPADAGDSVAGLICCCFPFVAAAVVGVVLFKLLAGGAQRRRRRDW